KTALHSSLRWFVRSVPIALALAAGFVSAQTPMDEEAPWPRVRTTNSHTVTLHLPQVESWTSNSFVARSAVALKMAGAKQALLVRNKADGKFYLSGDRLWFTAGSIQGPWALAQTPPPEVAALAPASAAGAAATKDEPVPRIVVRTRPAELLVTSGLPDFRPIR